MRRARVTELMHWSHFDQSEQLINSWWHLICLLSHNGWTIPSTFNIICHVKVCPLNNNLNTLESKNKKVSFHGLAIDNSDIHKVLLLYNQFIINCTISFFYNQYCCDDNRLWRFSSLATVEIEKNWDNNLNFYSVLNIFHIL